MLLVPQPGGTPGGPADSSFWLVDNHAEKARALCDQFSALSSSALAALRDVARNPSAMLTMFHILFGKSVQRGYIGNSPLFTLYLDRRAVRMTVPVVALQDFLRALHADVNSAHAGHVACTWRACARGCSSAGGRE